MDGSGWGATARSDVINSTSCRSQVPEERLVGITSSDVIFAEAGLRRELSRTKASAIREAPPCGRGVSLHLKKQQSVGLNMV